MTASCSANQLGNEGVKVLVRALEINTAVVEMNLR
jgi:hypothetical protein